MQADPQGCRYVRSALLKVVLGVSMRVERNGQPGSGTQQRGCGGRDLSRGLPRRRLQSLAQPHGRRSRRRVYSLARASHVP
jgi:hypothetical protein